MYVNNTQKYLVKKKKAKKILFCLFSTFLSTIQNYSAGRKSAESKSTLAPNFRIWWPLPLVERTAEKNRSLLLSGGKKNERRNRLDGQHLLVEFEICETIK
jgi:hypothetical protein